MSEISQSIDELCRCGCGQILPGTGFYKFIRGHRTRIAEIYAKEKPIIYCKCGCGRQIIFKEWHAIKAVNYVKGHNQGTVVHKFLEDNKGKHKCHCGCNEVITIRPAHHGIRGIPKFKPNHYIPDFIGQLSRSRSVSKRTKDSIFSFWHRVDILQKCGYKCVVCSETNRDLLEFDHIIPVCFNGQTTVENGQVLCRKCHAEKSSFEVSKNLRSKIQLAKINLGKGINHGN